MTATQDSPVLTEEAILRFLSGLWQLNRRLKQDVEPRLEAHGLDLRRYFILLAVDKGTRYPKALSERLHIPSTLLSRYLDQLVQVGYLERQIDTGDSRRTRLTLTEGGQDVLQRAIADIKAYTGTRLQDLDPHKLTVMLEAIETLGSAEIKQEKTP